MQTLETPTATKDYSQQLQDIRDQLAADFEKKVESGELPKDAPGPEQITGVGFRVGEDYKLGTVHMTVHNKDIQHTYVFTIKGSRDLALALRQAANRIEKRNLELAKSERKNGKGRK